MGRTISPGTRKRPGHNPDGATFAGIGLKLASALAFTLMSASVKLSAARYPVSELVFFRSVPALAVLVAWLAARREFPAALATGRPAGHVLRGFVGSASMFMSFSALAFISLPEATAIGYASPLFVVALAALTLGERVRVFRWSAVAAGFAGVVLMLHDPGAGPRGGAPAAHGFGVGLALGSAAFAAMAAIQIRRLTFSERTGAIVFWFTMTTAALSLLLFLAAAIWPEGTPGAATIRALAWTSPPLAELPFLLLIGVLGGIGQILMTQSYRLADASLIAAFDYSTMIWALALGLVVFGEWPSANVLAGAVVVIAAGIAVIAREHQLATRRSARAAAQDEILFDIPNENV